MAQVINDRTAHVAHVLGPACLTEPHVPPSATPGGGLELRTEENLLAVVFPGLGAVGGGFVVVSSNTGTAVATGIELGVVLSATSCGGAEAGGLTLLFRVMVSLMLRMLNVCWFEESNLTDQTSRLMHAVGSAWDELSNGQDIAVAVRSSATAEDLPDASFAGQQETFLNVRGLDNVIAAMHQVFASLFNDRAIAYRVHQDFEHSQVALPPRVLRSIG